MPDRSRGLFPPPVHLRTARAVRGWMVWKPRAGTARSRVPQS